MSYVNFYEAALFIYPFDAYWCIAEQLLLWEERHRGE